MSTEDEFTPEVLERIIVASLEKGDIESIGHAMRLLAVRDPHRAELLYDTMRLGLLLNERSGR